MCESETLISDSEVMPSVSEISTECDPLMLQPMKLLFIGFPSRVILLISDPVPEMEISNIALR